MKKTYILLCVILIMTAGCGTDTPIKIGVVGTMSGSQSDLSVSGRRGIEIAVDEINQNGGINGRPIELVVKDDKNDPLVASELVDEFVAEGIEVVIGHYTSGMMMAAYEKVQNSDILYIGPTVSTDTLNGLDDNFIRFIASTKEQAEIITRVAVSKEEYEFIVVVDEKNRGFSQKLLDNFTSNLVDEGGNIIETIYYSEVNDILHSEVETAILNNSRADALFMISNASDIALLSQLIHHNDNQLSIYGPLWAHTNDLIRIGGSAVEEINVVSGIDYDYESKPFMDFSTVYRAKYGEEMTFASIYSYEAMNAIALAMIGAKSTSYEKVKEEILMINKFEGLQKQFFIDEYGDNTREYMLDQIIDGEYKRVD